MFACVRTRGLGPLCPAWGRLHAMMKRKCGTCRYFNDRGIAGSGWCQHPARRELRDMVLVRKSELACRNGWDQDLWEPGAFGDMPIDLPDAPHIPEPTMLPRDAGSHMRSLPASNGRTIGPSPY